MEAGLFVEIAKQTPALIVLAWIVWKFLGFLEVSGKARDQVLHEIGSNCHTFQSQLADRIDDALNKVSAALDRNGEVMGSASGIVRLVEGSLDDHKTSVISLSDLAQRWVAGQEAILASLKDNKHALNNLANETHLHRVLIDEISGRNNRG